MKEKEVSKEGLGAVMAETLHRLRCPLCAASLRLTEGAMECTGCGTAYPIRDGVLLLARRGTPESSDDVEGSEKSSLSYQSRYEQIHEASKYNEAYREKRLKRWSTRREFSLLDRLLSAMGHSGAILDLPCGGGRLSQAIAAHTGLLMEADIAEGQVLYAKRTCTTGTPRIWMTASAFHIPLRDAAVDGVVCCRLCHHLPTQAERERLIEELLRVAGRFVLMTFFDYRSLKNTLRRMCRSFDGKPPKMTMTVAEVRAAARKGGARLVCCPPLSVIGSGHRYALMVKG